MALITIIPAYRKGNPPTLAMMEEEVLINKLVSPKERVARLEEGFYPLPVEIDEDVFPLFSSTGNGLSLSKVGLYRPMEFVTGDDPYCLKYSQDVRESLPRLKLRSATVEEAFEFLLYEPECLQDYSLIAMGSSSQTEGIIFPLFSILQGISLKVILVSHFGGRQISLKERGPAPPYFLIASIEE